MSSKVGSAAEEYRVPICQGPGMKIVAIDYEFDWDSDSDIFQRGSWDRDISRMYLCLSVTRVRGARH
jgi:hypothetical protein